MNALPFVKNPGPLAAALATASVLALAAPAALTAQQTCGPGDHWIDDCLMFDDDFPNSGAVVGVVLLAGGETCDGLPQPIPVERIQNLVLFGPTTVHRNDRSDVSANFPVGSVDGHLDVIDTEIVSMNLTSGSVALRVGDEATVPVNDSLGAIVEQAGDPALGDSFFEVFFEVSLPGGMLVYNQVPVMVETEIDRVPPDAVYLHIVTGPIPLNESPSDPMQPAVACLVTAQHITMPVAPLIPTLSWWGLAVLALALLVAAMLLFRRRFARAGVGG
jgi:hypothetical protein